LEFAIQTVEGPSFCIVLHHVQEPGRFLVLDEMAQELEQDESLVR
jgi:hypothetical protein